MAYILSTHKSWASTLEELRLTFSQWGVTQWDVYTDYARSARKTSFTPEERRVTVKFTKDGKEVILPMDKQRRPEDNLRVLYLSIESLRMNEKRGISEVIASSYLQLQAPVQEKNPYEVLGIFDNAPLEVAEAVYKVKVKDAHPDTGGSVDQIKELNRAIEQIRQKHE